MKFTIWKVKNGYLLNVTYSRQRVESFIFKESERYKMLALVDSILDLTESEPNRPS